MRIGLQVIRFDWPDTPHSIGTTLASIARMAEEHGFASLWVMDHFFQMGEPFGPVDAPLLESHSAIAYLAGITRRIKVGVLVAGNIYRHPGILIKTVSTLDVLSGGRAYFGIGAGWYEQEARGLGIPFPPLRERFERLEETLRIAKHMWSGDRTPYIGRYYQLEEPINSPQPLSTPHPPILIGGGGEQKTLRLVASYADACNLHAGDAPENYAKKVQAIQHKLMVLQRHCEVVGRPYDAIERTALTTVYLGPGGVTASAVVELCRSLADIGIQHVIFNMPNAHELTPIEIFGREIIPIVAGFA
jgi:F420-dependent oxidoreductase-like protein